MTSTDPILVIGGTGKTGRRVAARLAARGVPVRIGSRTGTPPFDWEDPATWAPALRGTRAAYISFFPDLAVPGAPAAIAELARTALAAGTRRLVLLSGRGEEEAERAEQELIASGADWTIVRCSWFSQNFSEDHFHDHVMAGELALPVGDVPEPFVDADDIADVAVAALTDDRHVGELYELTGPRLLTFADAAREIGEAAGRSVRLTPVSARQFAEPGIRESPGQGTHCVVIVREETPVAREIFDRIATERHLPESDEIGSGVERSLRRRHHLV